MKQVIFSSAYMHDTNENAFAYTSIIFHHWWAHNILAILIHVVSFVCIWIGTWAIQRNLNMWILEKVGGTVPAH